MQKSLRTLLFLALAITLCAATAQATLFSNGSFENPTSTNVGSFLTLGPGSTAISSWTVGAHGIDWIGTYWTPQDGARSLDMSGGVGDAGSIAQAFDTTSGQQYQVDFWMAGNPDGGPTIKTLHVNATGGPPNIFTFDITGHSLPSMGWVEHSFLFTAVSASTTLTFTSQDNSGYGPALDNVSVTAVPVPPAILLLGSGLLGLAVTRRGRRKA